MPNRLISLVAIGAFITLVVIEAQSKALSADGLEVSIKKCDSELVAVITNHTEDPMRFIHPSSVWGGLSFSIEVKQGEKGKTFLLCQEVAGSVGMKGPLVLSLGPEVSHEIHLAPTMSMWRRPSGMNELKTGECFVRVVWCVYTDRPSLNGNTIASDWFVSKEPHRWLFTNEKGP